LGRRLVVGVGRLYDVLDGMKSQIARVGPDWDDSLIFVYEGLPIIIDVKGDDTLLTTLSFLRLHRIIE
jgi:hypothetical protein